MKKFLLLNHLTYTLNCIYLRRHFQHNNEFSFVCEMLTNSVNIKLKSAYYFCKRNVDAVFRCLCLGASHHISWAGYAQR